MNVSSSGHAVSTERESALEEQPLPATSICGLVRALADAHPDRPALRFAGRTLTLRELDSWSEQVAAGLSLRSVGVGDRVGVMLPNGLHYPVTWIALAKLGAVIVPLNPSYGDHDLGHVLTDSDTGLIVTDALDERPTLRRAVPAERLVEFADLGRQGESAPVGGLDSPEPEPSALLNIQYTSGTTGSPKGVMLTHDYWLRLGGIAAEISGLGPDDVVLTAQPFYYLDPQWTTVMCLMAGATLVIAPRFSAATFWRSVRDEQVTHFYVVGTMSVMLLKQPPDPELDRAHRVRGVFCSGIPPQLHAELEHRWGVPWREAFGMTETGVDLVVPFEDTASVGSGSIGREVPGKQARVVDADDNEVADGEIGELVVRGRPRMEGYWRNPAATAAMIRDGWMHTGDLGYRDASGAFHLAGRMKDMIRRGGENVAAAEVESVLVEHPAVLAAAVVAVPDEIRGEEVLAYLQPVGEEAELSQVLRFAADRLAGFKVPRYWRWRADMPLTPSERIAKHKLVAEDGDPRVGAWDAAG